MAGGKLTPRQKMINLMYLVFIAMQALTMSKEVLTAFGLMNEKLETSNVVASEQNKLIYEDLKQKAIDSPEQYGDPKEIADQVIASTNEFYSFIDTVKPTFTDGVRQNEDGSYDYEVMDKTIKNDDWFIEGRYTAKGEEIESNINKYRESLAAALSSDPKYRVIVDKVNRLFNTDDVVDREGITKPYLDYHYKGYPAVASLTKLTALQNDAKVLESEILNALIGNTALTAASMSNYTAIVVLDKSAFFQGEAVTGRVVLGRYDESTVPTEVSVTGGETKIENGQAVFSIGAGSVGEHDIKGQFIFMEDGKPVPIEIEGKYVVVPKPNSATISADKMNSIYRGVDNPMTISFAGVSDNNVKATAQGLRAAGSGGKYIWRPDGIQGREATVTVNGKLPDGTSVSDKRTFIVRNIPAPLATLRGRTGTHRGNKNDLLNSTIGVSFPDFVFDINVNVTSFEVSVPGNPRVIVQGNRLNAQAQAAINKARVGDIVVIGNVKTSIPGSNVIIQDSAPFTWEIQ